MFDKVQVLDWTLEVDKEATAAAQQNMSGECQCGYCRNYRLASRDLPTAFLSLLDSLGIDPARPSEISEVSENGDGTHLYLGMYHLVGRIISGPDYADNYTSKRYMPFNGFGLGFTAKQIVHNFAGSLHPPIVQIDCSVTVLWLLADKA